MSNVLELGKNQLMADKEKNSKSLEDHQVGSTEKEKIMCGDHLPPTTSGTTTMVPNSFVKILDSVRV
jgi:hypothetical protein